MCVCSALAAVRGGSSPHSSSMRASAETRAPPCRPSMVRTARGLAPGIATGVPCRRTWRGPKTPSSTGKRVLISMIVGGAIQYLVKIR